MDIDSSELADLDPFEILDVESDRLDRFFASLMGDKWASPSRCRGWTIRDVLAHLAGDEVYNQAALDDRLGELFARAGRSGVADLDGFNEWMVRERAGQPVEEVLEEWRAMNADTRRRMRGRGRDAMLSTSIGPYPVGLQSFHLASEAATHADDVGAPVGPEETPGRVAWRARFSRFALKEKDFPVEVEPRAGRNTVRLGDRDAILTDEEFVAAAVARLPEDHPLDGELRAALRCLA